MLDQQLTREKEQGNCVLAQKHICHPESRGRGAACSRNTCSLHCSIPSVARPHLWQCRHWHIVTQQGLLMLRLSCYSLRYSFALSIQFLCLLLSRVPVLILQNAELKAARQTPSSPPCAQEEPPGALTTPPGGGDGVK